MRAGSMISKFVKILLFFSGVGMCACTSEAPNLFHRIPEKTLFICANKPLGDLGKLKICLKYGDASYSRASGEVSCYLVGTITNFSKDPIVIPDAYPQLSSLCLTDRGCIEGAYTTDLFLDVAWKNSLKIKEDNIAWLLPACPREKEFRGILIEGGQCMRFIFFFRIDQVQMQKNSSTLKIKIADSENRFESNEIEFFVWDTWKM